MFRDINYLFAYSFLLLEKPAPRDPESFCLNVDVPSETVSLNCEPKNADESPSPLMYRWTFGPSEIVLPSMQSVYTVRATDMPGNYTCTVSNSLGSEMAIYHVVGNEISFLYATFYYDTRITTNI